MVHKIEKKAESCTLPAIFFINQLIKLKLCFWILSYNRRLLQ